MLNFIKKQKAILVMIIVAMLGWAGFTVTQEQVSPVVDKALSVTEDATIAVKEIQEKKQAKEQAQQTAEDRMQSPDAPSTTQNPDVKQDFNRASAITPQRRTHILYGDATGGGHLHGTGAPCKSEFPKHWNEETIIKEVDIIAANDNLNWRQQNNGYYVAEQNVGTVRVRVVKGRNNENVITAYPTNTPRNPCPANDR